MEPEPEISMLVQEIINCKLCPRLVEYRVEVARKKVRRFRDFEYWGRPLPGFGDLNARLLIVGLAPAAHGGNRTGRMFTGDSSGDWLIKALYETGFANQPVSRYKDDGLKLIDCYVTAVARCAPPKNKLLRSELINCQRYLIREFEILRNVKAILTLGRISFDWTLKALKTFYGLDLRSIQFRHGVAYDLWDLDKRLFVSYHPSRQNTQTGRLTWDMWIEVFRSIRSYLDGVG